MHLSLFVHNAFRLDLIWYSLTCVPEQSTIAPRAREDTSQLLGL